MLTIPSLRMYQELSSWKPAGLSDVVISVFVVDAVLYSFPIVACHGEHKKNDFGRRRCPLNNAVDKASLLQKYNSSAPEGLLSEAVTKFPKRRPTLQRAHEGSLAYDGN